MSYTDGKSSLVVFGCIITKQFQNAGLFANSNDWTPVSIASWCILETTYIITSSNQDCHSLQNSSAHEFLWYSDQHPIKFQLHYPPFPVSIPLFPCFKDCMGNAMFQFRYSCLFTLIWVILVMLMDVLTTGWVPTRKECLPQQFGIFSCILSVNTINSWFGPNCKEYSVAYLYSMHHRPLSSSFLSPWLKITGFLSVKIRSMSCVHSAFCSAMAMAGNGVAWWAWSSVTSIAAAQACPF